MTRRSWQSRFVAALALFSLSGFLVPVSADTATVRLTGTVQSIADKRPMAGARVFAADPGSGTVYPTDPTDADGRFRFADLPPAQYRLGVQLDEGLYLVETPVALQPGDERQVTVGVNRDEAAGTGADPGGYQGATPSVWNNPLTAALVVLGSAVVVGVLVENATDDEDDISPF